MEEIKVCAGIVLYNPDIGRLSDNISSIISQVNEIVLIDNASDNKEEIQELISGNTKKISCIRNNSNCGIAYALNQILKFAENHGYPLFLTLDQDSVCCESLVNEYLNCWNEKIGQLTCNVFDRNAGEVDKVDFNGKGKTEIEYCITSGSANNTKAIRKIGGYNEYLFIDGVDLDLSLRLREAGYSIVRIDYDGLMHQIGEGGQVSVLGKDISLSNHSPWRNYYARRNMIYVARRHYRGIRKAKMIGKQIIYAIGVVLIENQKANRLKQNCKGVLDGFKMPLY